MKKILLSFILLFSGFFSFLGSTGSVEAATIETNSEIEIADNDLENEIKEALDEDTLKIWNDIDTYLSEDENGITVFNEKAAAMNNESDELIEFGLIMNDLAETSDHDKDFMQYRLNILVYGNYCGYGNRGGRAIDNLDRACQSHDSCYNHGGNNYNCDYNFVRKLLPIIQTTPKGTWKHTVAVVAAKSFVPR